MSDPVVPMLAKAIEFYEGKQRAIEAVLAHMRQTLTLINENGWTARAQLAPMPEKAAPTKVSPVRDGRLEKQRKLRKHLKDAARKAKPAARTFSKPRKGRSADAIPHEQIIDCAIGAIRKGGPQPLKSISAAVRKAYPAIKNSIGAALRQEEVRAGSRIGRDGAKRWIEKTTARRVADTRTPEEVDEVMRRARANAQNPVTSEIHV